MWLLINIKANMKIKLIKINEEHYIIVDGFEVKKGDFMYDIDGDIGIAIGEDKSQWEGNMKITHSTQLIDGDEVGACFTKIKQLSLSEVEELLFGYNAEKMAESKWNEIVVNLKLDTLHKGMWCGGFQHGFNAHKELVKDKLFTVHDMLKISQAAFVIKSNNETIIEDFENWFNKRIKLLQPTEWEVEFINGKLTLKQ